MNNSQLQYFVETVKNGSMRKAAKVLNTTQPNISASISMLEKEVGATLLIRSNKGIGLTPEGQKFFTIAEGVTERLSVLRNMFLTKKPANHLILNIATNPSQVTTEVLAELQKDLVSDNYYITVRNYSVQKCASSVQSLESEIGIVFITSGYGPSYKAYFSELGLEYFSTSIRSCCVNVGRLNPYYDRDSVTRDEIIRFPIARFIEDELSYLDFSITEEGISIGDNPKVYYFNSDSQILSFVAQTDAYKVGYPWCKEAYERFGIHCLKIVPDYGIPLEMGWIKRKGYDLSAPAAEFIQRFENKYRDV